MCGCSQLGLAPLLWFTDDECAACLAQPTVMRGWHRFESHGITRGVKSEVHISCLSLLNEAVDGSKVSRYWIPLDCHQPQLSNIASLPSNPPERLSICLLHTSSSVDCTVSSSQAHPKTILRARPNTLRPESIGQQTSVGCVHDA